MIERTPATREDKYIQLPLGKPFELYTEKNTTYEHIIRPEIRHEVIKILSERGFPINLQYTSPYSHDEGNYKRIPFTASKDGIDAIDRVLKEPQVKIMSEALNFNSVSSSVEDEIHNLKEKMSNYTWPKEYTVNQLLAEAYFGASDVEFGLAQQSEELGRTFHYTPNVEKINEYHNKGKKLKAKAEIILRQIPEQQHWKKRIGKRDVAEVVSGAVDRIFMDNTTLIPGVE